MQLRLEHGILVHTQCLLTSMLPQPLGLLNLKVMLNLFCTNSIQGSEPADLIYEICLTL